MKNIRNFIWKFSFLGRKKINVFEKACFRNGLHRARAQSERSFHLAHISEGTFPDVAAYTFTVSDSVLVKYRNNNLVPSI